MHKYERGHILIVALGPKVSGVGLDIKETVIYINFTIILSDLD